MNFKEFLRLKEQNTVGTHNDTATGAFVTSNEPPDSLEGRGNTLPTQTLQPGLAIRRGIIKSLGEENSNQEPTKNPIPILLSDNSRLSLTWDQYRRIGKPQKGWEMTVQFLRSNDDDSESPSGIHTIETRDPSGKVYKYHNWPD